MPSAAVRRLSPLQWAGVGLGGCMGAASFSGAACTGQRVLFPLLSLWAWPAWGSLFWRSALSVWQASSWFFLPQSRRLRHLGCGCRLFYWTLSSRSFIYVWDYANYLLKQYDAEAAFCPECRRRPRVIFGSMADDYTNFITLFTEFPFCLTSHTGDACFLQSGVLHPADPAGAAGRPRRQGRQILNVKNRTYYFLFGMTLTAVYPFLRMARCWPSRTGSDSSSRLRFFY